MFRNCDPFGIDKMHKSKLKRVYTKWITREYSLRTSTYLITYFITVSLGVHGFIGYKSVVLLNSCMWLVKGKRADALVEVGLQNIYVWDLKVEFIL